MKNKLNKRAIIFSALLLLVTDIYSQQNKIKDLRFLIGTWEVRENNKETEWWEKCIRTGQFILDSTYIQMESTAITSTGKQRVYRFLIHYNSEDQQFEMVSIYSNWPKVQFDILTWNSKKRILTIKNKNEVNEYHERFGEIVFNENFNEYIWVGENKYGDSNKPSVWKYEEKGIRIKK